MDMKKSVLLNSVLSSVISEMGHTDMLTIADCGLPIGGGVKRIDLALKFGVPGFLETLETVLTELCVESALLAEEIKTACPEMNSRILAVLGEKITVSYVSHEEFKKITRDSKAVVRTGESTPYSNIILISGVTF